MKQVFQSLDSGETEVIEVPAPGIAPGHVLVRTEYSVISAGTERILVSFGRANLLEKARQQPDRVRQVLDKVVTDGLTTTIAAVRNRLAEPIELGYATAGRVLQVGDGVEGLAVGDLVATNGPHAEVTLVPQTLVAKVPDESAEVNPAHAAFATIGAIALQGVRLAKPSLGERFVVTGLGLVGLLTTQLLIANGCRVLGLDLDESRLELAKAYGADVLRVGEGTDPVAVATRFSSQGQGVDGVIVAATTESDEPMRQAIKMCRKRGRVVLVGVTGLSLERGPLYDTEVSIRVSSSYGPGRYDPDYESGLGDYPLAHVRWTAGRNMAAFLEMLAAESVDVSRLITHEFDLDDAARAYGALTTDPTALAISLQHATHTAPAETVGTEGAAPEPAQTLQVRPAHRPTGTPRVAVIGAGNYARNTLLPALSELDVNLHTIVSQHGGSAGQLARQYGFAEASTNWRATVEHDDVEAVFVTTRHDTHAEITIAALQAGKHVYCEKPLALHVEDIDAIEAVLAAHDDDTRPLLQVGFNRRHAPLAIELQQLISRRNGPASIVITVNAGNVPKDHWVHNPDMGGGRIVGEACHFVDLAAWLVDAQIERLDAVMADTEAQDQAHILMKMTDGSAASVNYLSAGHPRFPKERVQVFVPGAVHEMDNWRALTSTPRRRLMRLPVRQDKGHTGSFVAFFKQMQSPSKSGAVQDAVGVSRALLALVRP